MEVKQHFENQAKKQITVSELRKSVIAALKYFGPLNIEQLYCKITILGYKVRVSEIEQTVHLHRGEVIEAKGFDVPTWKYRCIE